MSDHKLVPFRRVKMVSTINVPQGATHYTGILTDIDNVDWYKVVTEPQPGDIWMLTGCEWRQVTSVLFDINKIDYTLEKFLQEHI